MESKSISSMGNNPWRIFMALCPLLLNNIKLGGDMKTKHEVATEMIDDVIEDIKRSQVKLLTQSGKIALLVELINYRI
jgi:hypothetical protein